MHKNLYKKKNLVFVIILYQMCSFYEKQLNACMLIQDSPMCDSRCRIKHFSKHGS